MISPSARPTCFTWLDDAIAERLMISFLVIMSQELASYAFFVVFVGEQCD
jgi:hypothetical protein